MHWGSTNRWRAIDRYFIRRKKQLWFKSDEGLTALWLVSNECNVCFGKDITKLIKGRKHATRYKFVSNSTQIFSITLFALSLHIPMNTYQFCWIKDARSPWNTKHCNGMLLRRKLQEILILTQGLWPTLKVVREHSRLPNFGKTRIQSHKLCTLKFQESMGIFSIKHRWKHLSAWVQ